MLDNHTISIICSILAASLCALGVHEIAWALRRRALILMSIAGVLSVGAFVFSAGYLMFAATLASGWGAEDSSDQTVFLTNFGLNILLFGGVTVVVMLFLGWLHETQFSSSFWTSMLSIYGEMGMVIIAGFFVKKCIYSLQYDWFAYSWFNLLLIGCFLFLALTRPLHERIMGRILQTGGNWFRLK